MDAQNDVNRGEFTWKIRNFSEQDGTKLYSEAFTASGCKWRILVFPKGNETEHLSLFLAVADSATLPNGWTRKAKLSLSVIDQINHVRSIRKGDHGEVFVSSVDNILLDEQYEIVVLDALQRYFPMSCSGAVNKFVNWSLNSAETQHDFTAREIDWGFSRFIRLTELRNLTGGYLANDTLVVKAEVCVLRVTPPVNIQPARPTDMFDSYFTGLEEFVNAADTNGVSVGSTSCHQDGALTAELPSLEEVEKAKQSLKECLSDLFKLNMKERLFEALSTLSSARIRLSSEQQIAIETFRANFNDFTSDFLTFEQDNAEFELHKLQRDERFSAMKKCQETHILYKQLMEDLVKKEEEHKRKTEEVKFRREKLLSDWEILLVESEEAKSGFKDEQKKVAEAEEKKRIAEERMSRSTNAWSNLKAQFG